MFGRSERGRAFGAIGMAVGIATAAGPVVGGFVIAAGGPHLGWRLTFLINVPVGITSFLLCRAWLPSADRRGGRRRMDLPGAGLLALSVFGVLFPAVQFDAHRDLRLALILVPAVLLLAGFFCWEAGPARRLGHPLIDIALFSVRSYASGVALALLYFCAYTGTPLVLALFLQEGLGFSALQSGLTATPYAVGAAVSAPIGGRLVSRMGRTLLLGALSLFAVGVAAAAAVADRLAGVVPPGHVALALVVPLLLAGLGGGSVITPNQALSLADVDVAGGSTAGGMLQTSQRIGSAVGAAVITAAFYATVAGAAGGGAGRQSDYGRGYASGLAISLLFTAGALLLAVRDVRRSGGGGLAQPALPAR